jgi:GNAT superfamily N-acetyltransferase
MTNKIRMADEHDEFEIFKLCAMMHEEQPYHPLSWDKVVPMIHLATRRERGIIGVIGERHDLKGAVFLVIDPIWYSDDWQLLEFFNYVRPDSRRSSFAQDLLKFSKKCADDLGLDLTVGVFSTIRTEGKCRLYRRMIPKVGEFYCYTPPNRPTLQQRILEGMEPANQVAAE